MGSIKSIFLAVLIYLFISERYNVDKSQISISGISSGGAMATQMHVIYSSHFMGVGIVAGSKYFIVYELKT